MSESQGTEAQEFETVESLTALARTKIEHLVQQHGKLTYRIPQKKEDHYAAAFQLPADKRQVSIPLLAAAFLEGDTLGNRIGSVQITLGRTDKTHGLLGRSKEVISQDVQVSTSTDDTTYQMNIALANEATIKAESELRSEEARARTQYPKVIMGERKANVSDLRILHQILDSAVPVKAS